jgi:hypothetical protein
MSSFRLKFSPFARSLLRRILVGVVIAYVCFGTFMLWAMRQSPETFGRVMARMPGPAPFLLFPFETAWMQARAGKLRVGDPAPDFALASWRNASAFAFPQSRRKNGRLC